MLAIIRVVLALVCPRLMVDMGDGDRIQPSEPTRAPRTPPRSKFPERCCVEAAVARPLRSANERRMVSRDGVKAAVTCLA